MKLIKFTIKPHQNEIIIYKSFYLKKYIILKWNIKSILFKVGQSRHQAGSMQVALLCYDFPQFKHSLLCLRQQCGRFLDSCSTSRCSLFLALCNWTILWWLCAVLIKSVAPRKRNESSLIGSQFIYFFGNYVLPVDTRAEDWVHSFFDGNYLQPSCL